MRTELIEKLKGKLVFFDFDGTLSEFRFFDKVGPETVTGELLYKFSFENVYDNVRPLSVMQQTIANMNPENVYILGAITINHEIEEKYKWLVKYYPTIKKENIIFVNSADSKLGILEAYSKKFNMKSEDIVFVDDMHYTILKAEELGFTAYHPSSFID